MQWTLDVVALDQQWSPIEDNLRYGSGAAGLEESTLDDERIRVGKHRLQA